MLCECCGENEVWGKAQEHGYNHCEECCECNVCDCGKLLDDPVYIWEEGECERCRKDRETHEWIESTAADVERLAKSHGWAVGDWHYANESLSRYIDLTRVINEECETITVRVSDHGTAYCNEDYSLALNPGGDDHTLEILADRFSR